MDILTAARTAPNKPTTDDFHEEVLKDDSKEYTIRFVSERHDGQRFWGVSTAYIDDQGEPSGVDLMIATDSPQPDEEEEQRILDATEEMRQQRRLQEQA